MTHTQRFFETLESRQFLSVAVPLAGVAPTPTVQSTVVQAAAPTFSGTYTTALKTGTITYTVTRLFPRVGSGGWVVVDGKRYWGVMATSGGVTGLTWYYGTNSTGPEAGRAYLTLQTDGSYTGPIQFTSRTGKITGTGTVVLR